MFRGSLRVRIPERWGTSQGPRLKTRVLSPAHCPPLLRWGGGVSIAPSPGRSRGWFWTYALWTSPSSTRSQRQAPRRPDPGTGSTLFPVSWAPRLQLLTVETRPGAFPGGPERTLSLTAEGVALNPGQGTKIQQDA